MKRKSYNLRQKKIISTILLCIFWSLFLSFLMLGNSNYNYDQVSISNSPMTIQTSSNNPPEKLWNTTWGGTGMDDALGLALDSSDNIYVVGKTNSTSFSSLMLSQPPPPTISDMFLLKYDSSGHQEWYRTWGGVEDDWGRSLVTDSSDNIFIVGSTQSFGAGSTDVALIKYNSLGEKQWNTTWGTSSSDSGSAIALDSSGNIFIAGGHSGDMILAKFNSLGVYQWNRTWGGPNSDSGWAMAIDSSNNIYVTGLTLIVFNPPSDINFDLFLTKYNSQGILQWDTTWGGSGFEDAHSIELDSSGNIFVSGETSSFGAGGYDISLVKFNGSGDLQWNTTWGGSGSEGGWDLLALDSLDNIYLGGGTDSFGPGLNAGAVVKFNNSGHLQWNTTWGGAGENGFSGIVIDSSDNIYVAGFTDSFGFGMNDVVLVKYRGSTTGNGAGPIPGYDLSLLLGAICVISIIFIKKQHKSTASHPTN